MSQINMQEIQAVTQATDKAAQIQKAQQEKIVQLTQQNKERALQHLFQVQLYLSRQTK